MDDRRDPFRGGGDVGRDLAAVDWSATPLGDPASWPDSLRAVVRVLLGSRFAMWMAWGPELTFLCNDAYRRDTLGTKYPWALGRPANVVWEEIWPDIGPRIERVMATGDATWDESLLLFLERSGYKEETYHTFSYSPLRADDGSIAGMLCVVSEETERVVADRRLGTLRELGVHLAGAQGEDGVLEATAAALGANDQSLPFVLLYRLAEDGGGAELVCRTHIAEGHPAAPAHLPPAGGIWPLDEAETLVTGLPARFADLPTGAWDEPPEAAMVVALGRPGEARPWGWIVAALNRYRPLDEGHFAFVRLLAGQVAAALSGALAYEAAQERAERLAELDRAKTAFFTNASHELRTPLTLLLGPAEDALADERHPLDPVQRRRVELVDRNAQRLLRLVNTLLDFQRLEQGAAAARFEPLDLSQTTAELAAMFETAVQRAGLDLVVDCDPVGEPVFADREMWAKIVLNLLSNALKFTFEGRIAVRVARAGDRVRLEVSDTGVGIAPAEQERLFERFRRIAGTRARSHEGSGIGLALVAELAGLHGGAASVRSTLGEGSTFAVELPLGDAHVPAEQRAGAGAGTDGEDPAAGHAGGYLAEALRWVGEDGDGEEAPRTVLEGPRPRILVVDDNSDMRDYVAGLLASEYEVLEAADGQEALELALADPPDLVLTDVMMPRLDGFGLLAALRAEPATTGLPVVILSARAGEEGTVEGLQAGASDYLVKPFAARELLARVRANLELDRVRRTRDALEGSRALLDQAQRLAGVGSWELDLATGDVRGSDEFLRQLRLTADELAAMDVGQANAERVHPDDIELVREAMRATVEDGTPLDYEVRLVLPGDEVRYFRTLGEVVRDADGRPVLLRGSNQDVTEQRRAQEALAAAAAEREAAAREHRIADELQRSLLPASTFDPGHLEVAAAYRPGVAGTQVGGDWYDVIDLGAGRTALVIGDVMGRGVRAAAVMGQLRAAVRAYARLDLPPADVLESLDGVVRDLDEEQIVTCVYAVHDPADGSLTYANAGHLPPLLLEPGGEARRLDEGGGPPLGAGPCPLREVRVPFGAGAIVALYTDGVVERRDQGLDAGIATVAGRLGLGGPVESLPDALADSLDDRVDDDIAVLVARATSGGGSDEAVAVTGLPAEAVAAGQARAFLRTTLGRWGVAEATRADAVLLVSELVTNALLHGRPPLRLRVRRGAREVVLEVRDGARVPPQRVRSSADDEHGRGLELVAALAERWGTRPLPDGKVVWCVLAEG